MIAIGYALSAEEHGPRELARFAQRAEEVGFDLAAISDHFHPWIDRQGASPFAWGVLGAIAERTERIVLGTRVTCPTFRVHPAIVAQAAATAAVQLEGRFFLGVGSGEALNEHITGQHWPPAPERLDRLAEAIEVIRGLWTGEEFSHRSDRYPVEYARLYTRPEEPPPLLVAASGSTSASLAGGEDGVIAVVPDGDLLSQYADAGGRGMRFGEVKVCWAEDEAEARRVARDWWPMVALSGGLGTELHRPRQFEAATERITEDEVAEVIACGPDPERHVAAVRQYAEAGFDAVWVHQVGPDQDGFFGFYEREVLPRLDRAEPTWWEQLTTSREG